MTKKELLGELKLPRKNLRLLLIQDALKAVNSELKAKELYQAVMDNDKKYLKNIGMILKDYVWYIIHCSDQELLMSALVTIRGRSQK
jgi:threonyl-tRNA synthetase